jgi:hypothetical protein
MVWAGWSHGMSSTVTKHKSQITFQLPIIHVCKSWSNVIIPGHLDHNVLESAITHATFTVGTHLVLNIIYSCSDLLLALQVTSRSRICKTVTIACR